MITLLLPGRPFGRTHNRQFTASNGRVDAVRILARHDSGRIDASDLSLECETLRRQGAAGVVVPVRRTAEGVLICAQEPSDSLGRPWCDVSAEGSAAARVADLLDVWRGRGVVVCDVLNTADEPDFDAPHEATARALVALLATVGAGEVVAASDDWYAVELARDAGVMTAFRTGPRVSAGAGIAYAASSGHRQVHAHVSVVEADPQAAIAQAAAAKVELAVWGVATMADAGRLEASGVRTVIVDSLEGATAVSEMTARDAM